MDSQHKEQATLLEKDLDNLGKRFDRHLEIYAKNGKELQAVKTNQQWLMRFFFIFISPMFAGIAYIVFNINI